MIPPSRKLTCIGSGSGSVSLRKLNVLVRESFRGDDGDNGVLNNEAMALALRGDMALRSIYVRLEAIGAPVLSHFCLMAW
jgi:hypothetical protein